ncbi:MAG TPA: HEAT repeat domain-containing protein [Pseudonocardiaceae bacterium]|nr:HEAT repeat domain-containing protein [Pseudonocardiaceae bacterium]
MTTERDAESINREARIDEAIAERADGLLELLLAAVADPDPEIRGTVAYGLGEVADDRAIPALVDLVEHDRDETVVLHALKAMESYRDPRIHRTLLHEAERARTTRSPRWYAATELAWYDSEQSVDALLHLLASQDVLVRQAAEESLVTLRPQDRARWERLAAEQDY